MARTCTTAWVQVVDEPPTDGHATGRFGQEGGVDRGWRDITGRHACEP